MGTAPTAPGGNRVTAHPHPPRTLGQGLLHPEGKPSQTPDACPAPPHHLAGRSLRSAHRRRKGRKAARGLPPQSLRPLRGHPAGSEGVLTVHGRGPGGGAGVAAGPAARATAEPFARGGNAPRAPAVASLPGIQARLRAAPLLPPPREGAGNKRAPRGGRRGRARRCRRRRRRLRGPGSRARTAAAEELLARRPLPGLAERLDYLPGLGSAWKAGPAITHNVFRGFRGPSLADRRS